MTRRLKIITRLGVVLVLVAGLTLILGSCAGRGTVDKDLDAYRPPVLYRDLLAETGPDAPRDSAREDRAVEARKAELEDLQRAWAGKTWTSPGRRAFLTPDPDRLARVLPGFTQDAAALDAVSGDFDLRDLEILVLGRNPMIHSAETILRATLEAYSQASVLGDVIRSYSALNAQIMTGVGDMEAMDSIDKLFPFPGTLSLKGNIVTQEVTLAWIDLDMARRSAVTDARKAYWELVYTRGAREILGQTLTLLDSLAASTARRVETGQSRMPDLNRIFIRIETLKEDLATLAERETAIRDRLAALVLLPSGTAMGNPSGSVPDLKVPRVESLVEAALDHRQELEKLRIRIIRAELMVEMAETRIYPGFHQNLSLTGNRAVTQAGTLAMEPPFLISAPASTGAGLPRGPWTGLLDGYLRETRQRLSALRQELAGAEAQTWAAVRQAWVEADRADREHRLVRDRINTLSQVNFAGMTRAYESGVASFSETLDALLLVLEIRVGEERKRADLGIALAAVYETVGSCDGFQYTGKETGHDR